jgi:hypothetical protein
MIQWVVICYVLTHAGLMPHSDGSAACGDTTGVSRRALWSVSPLSCAPRRLRLAVVFRFLQGIAMG